MSSEYPSGGNGDGSRERTERPKAKGKVFLKAEALKSVILYAKRYANETIPEYDWKEVYGFLIGRIKGQDVYDAIKFFGEVLQLHSCDSKRLL